MAIGGCSKPNMAYEKFVEGQDVYLECHSESSSAKLPDWYSFDTDPEGESTGYYWNNDNPMFRGKLSDVNIGVTEITFRKYKDKIWLKREKLTYRAYGLKYQCYSIGYQTIKDHREKRFKELTKNNKI